MKLKVSKLYPSKPKNIVNETKNEEIKIEERKTDSFRSRSRYKTNTLIDLDAL